jgi:hypothetical protein
MEGELMINKILKKIAENSSEAAKVRIKMKELGFKWCSTGGPCEAYHKDIGDGKSMYVVGESETEVPETFNETYGVAIFEDKGETEKYATFNGYDDFAANYMDMSKYEDVDY